MLVPQKKASAVWNLVINKAIDKHCSIRICSIRKWANGTDVYLSAYRMIYPQNTPAVPELDTQEN